MNVDNLIKEVRERYERELDTIAKICELGIADKISFISRADVFTKSLPFSELMDLLTKIRGSTTMTMMHYQENTGCLAINYTSGNGIGFIFMCSDIENALEKVSGGKCKLEEITGTQTTVVCNI